MKHVPLLSAAMLAFAASPVIAQQAPAPETFVDALEGVFGAQPGFRRSHAKGVCATGTFVGNAEGRNLSRASLFDGGRHQTIASSRLAEVTRRSATRAGRYAVLPCR
jgi:catalase